MKPIRLALAYALLIPIASLSARAEEAPKSAPASRVALGPAVINPEGQQGRLHTVTAGETLWDISEAYLGTPWVWPQVWQGDGSGSDRDVTLKPGDVLWVSSTEIRRLTPSEVAALPASAPPASADALALPDGAPDMGVASAPTDFLNRWVKAQSQGFLTAERMGFVGQIIGNPTERSALGTGDAIYIDMGNGQVQVGDRLRIVRRERNVPDPDTGRMIGMFIEPLGWAEVTVVEGDAAAAVIHGAVSEIGAGDLLLPPEDGTDSGMLPLQATSPGVRGEIVHMVAERVISGGMDVVYLNQGSSAGLQPGSALEVVRPGALIYHGPQARTIKVPDTIIGQLVVVSSTPSSAAAYILHSTTDLARGDFYRGAELK